MTQSLSVLPNQETSEENQDSLVKKPMETKSKTNPFSKLSNNWRWTQLVTLCLQNNIVTNTIFKV